MFPEEVALHWSFKINGISVGGERREEKKRKGISNEHADILRE